MKNVKGKIAYFLIAFVLTPLVAVIAKPSKVFGHVQGQATKSGTDRGHNCDNSSR